MCALLGTVGGECVGYVDSSGFQGRGGDVVEVYGGAGAGPYYGEAATEYPGTDYGNRARGGVRRWCPERWGCAVYVIRLELWWTGWRVRKCSSLVRSCWSEYTGGGECAALL
jgi:hypothetical protein